MGVDVVVSVAGLVVADTGVADDAGGAAAVVALSFDVDEPGGQFRHDFAQHFSPPIPLTAQK